MDFSCQTVFAEPTSSHVDPSPLLLWLNFSCKPSPFSSGNEATGQKNPPPISKEVKTCPTRVLCVLLSAPVTPSLPPQTITVRRGPVVDRFLVVAEVARRQAWPLPSATATM